MSQNDTLHHAPAFLDLTGSGAELAEIAKLFNQKDRRPSDPKSFHALRKPWNANRSNYWKLPAANPAKKRVDLSHEFRTLPVHERAGTKRRWAASTRTRQPRLI
jgi:hypothetical protein